jgi:TonB family protein
MVTPVYSLVAQRANVEGKVTVEVELNEDGEVVSANATSGHQMLRGSAEDAAKRSKFKPALHNNRPIKAKGVILYNFSLRAKR